MNDTPTLRTALATLVCGGFVLISTERNPQSVILLMQRVDEFGCEQRYAFAISDAIEFATSEIEACKISATHHAASLVLVGAANANRDVPVVSWSRFLNLFGGRVTSYDAIDPDFAANLTTLGHNQLPNGLSGEPDDLFEVHVRAALEFVLAGRVIRYGQDRRFEKRADGLAWPHESFCALYDAKAYGDGYPISSDAMRAFKDYVTDFQNRYSAFLMKLSSFIVVSGSFVQGSDALQARQQEMVAACGVPLSFITSQVLGEAIRLASGMPAARRAVNWSLIFASPVVTVDSLRSAFEAVRKDHILPRT